MPQAIGPQLAAQDQQVISISGDGGVSMVFGDLLTLQETKVTKLLPRNRVSGSYWSENSSSSSVKSFDLAVDPDVLLAEPLSKAAETAPSLGAAENPTSAD